MSFVHLSGNRLVAEPRSAGNPRSEGEACSLAFMSPEYAGHMIINLPYVECQRCRAMPSI